MRLKRIQLAGFKSFVDPTTITFQRNLVGIVGPNGCGKSNVIDALRWVMGEASARTLRGESMGDVIFNGSTARKPVGKASVELAFDNADRSAPGTYADFSELSIRRSLTRDGQSEYFINKVRCRRRDIIDIFLGTGLGPRSYSVIEQGTVSRIVEAKPEDLRVLIEEVAGISKYKDRRRETETRIRHTRENLERVADICAELASQLRRLKRQSQAARRYKELKQELRQVQAEMQVLQRRALAAQDSEFTRRLAQLETSLEQERAAQREVESQLEQLRAAQHISQDEFNVRQGEFYGVGAEIATLEQRIEHTRQTRRGQRDELERLGADRQRMQDQLDIELARRVDAERRLAALVAEFDAAQTERAQLDAGLAEIEARQDAWRESWDEFSAVAAQPVQQREVQRSRMAQLERQLQQLDSRCQRLTGQRAELGEGDDGVELAALRDECAAADAAWLTGEQDIARLEQQLRDTRVERERMSREVGALQAEASEIAARLKSLEEIQAAALGDNDQALQAWLTQANLVGRPRLAIDLAVTSGWERAVDSALGNRGGAIVVDSLDQIDLTDGVASAVVTMIEVADGTAGAEHKSASSLAAYAKSARVEIAPLLAGVRVAEGLPAALAARSNLADHECFVTRDGALVGRRWLQLGRQGSDTPRLVEREAEIAALKRQAATGEVHLARLRTQLEGIDQALGDGEQRLAAARHALRQHGDTRGALRDRLAREETRQRERSERRARLDHELAELDRQQLQDRAEHSEAERLLALAGQRSDALQVRRGELTAERDVIAHALQTARERARQARDGEHRLALEHQRLDTTISGGADSVARLREQTAQLDTRRTELAAVLAQDDDPERRLAGELQTVLDQRGVAERRLGAARDELERQDAAIRSQTTARAEREQGVAEARERIDAERIARQEIVVRLQTVDEHLAQSGVGVEELMGALPDQADPLAWRQRQQELEQKVERIGPVNLVAIEEFEEQSERKTHLDRQHADLCEALATLEGVMRKIDRETRTRFKETFEQVNAGFKEFFPRLFGGGHASLELTEDDLLAAGVTVIARPPGKRNSTIHLLSGGEKALTAVSLIFSFFKLNPAPFCLLDEVDAPLDDANVVRYCDTLRSLAGHTQLIFITHNKVTMQTADILVGVTMAEPGVSRLVSVDVEQAMEMAAS